MPSTSAASASAAAPAYDFVAPAKRGMPSGGSSASAGGNPAFAGCGLGGGNGSGGGTGPRLGAELVPGYLPAKPPGLSRLQKRLVAVPLAAVVALLVAYTGSIGLHAYQSRQRAQQIASTTVTFPAHVAGLTKKSSSRVAALINQVSTPAPAEGAAYQVGRSGLVTILAGISIMTDAEQHDFLTSAQASAHALGFTIRAVDAGRLGGQLWCGGNPHSKQTFCAFTDVAAYGAMTVPGAGPAAVRTAVDVRASIEHQG